MNYRGDFDPAAFDQSDTSTWPPADEYEPGDYWYVTGPGVVAGVDVAAGWRMFPRGVGRMYGELNYGDEVYGGEQPSPPWPPDPVRVQWSASTWADAPAWQRPPGPFDGCPFGDTGWRIVIEVLTTSPDARLYGSGTYGSGVYGDTLRPASDWLDIAHTSYGVTCRRGGTEAAPLVDVDEGTVELLDVDASLFALITAPHSDDRLNRAPGVNTPLRVGLIDPQGNPHPLYTGRIEQLADTADRVPRDVVIESFGMASDLVTSIDGYERAAEPVADRVAHLVAAAAYSWGIDPPTSTAPLRRVDRLDVAQVREQLDRAVLSAGLYASTNALGVIRFEPWPPEPVGDVVEVTDRLNTQALPAVEVDVVGDRDELLNVVTVSSEAVQGAAELVATATDGASVGRFGRSSESLTFPITGLSAERAGLDQLAAGARDRFSRVVNRVRAVEVDTSQDARWLAVLADLDAGRPFAISLTRPTKRTYSAILVGADYRITPGRIVATLYLSTLDPTL